MAHSRSLIRICGTNGLLETESQPGMTKANSPQQEKCVSGERGWYLDQKLEARDPLERQDEEGGEGQPPALGVQLQLRDQLPKGCLLLAGDTDKRVGLWLVGGANWRGFFPVLRPLRTRQPTSTENALISSLLSLSFF